MQQEKFEEEGGKKQQQLQNRRRGRIREILGKLIENVDFFSE